MHLSIGIGGHSNPFILFLSARCLAKTVASTGALSARDNARHRQPKLAALHRPPSSSVEYSVRPAQGQELWPVADVHCAAFYPHESPLMAPLLRLERVISMISGEGFQSSRRGHYVCLVAVAHDVDPDALSKHRKDAQNLLIRALTTVLPERVRPGVGIAHRNQGVLGALVMDTLGEHIPKTRVEVSDRTQWEPPRGVAYISNLAVSPCARRQGVGKLLMNAAENAARDWGCRITALHCDPRNQSASGLYKGLGYTCPLLVDGCEELIGTGGKGVRKGSCELLVKPVGVR